MTAALVLALLVGGGGILCWRPWRGLGGQSPRMVVGLIVISAAAVWAGSLGLVVIGLTDASSGFMQACETLWRRMVTGELSWVGWSLVTLWATFPARAALTVASSFHETRLLRRRLRCVATPVGPDDSIGGLAVPSLGTPAVTVGLVRPEILVDREFWQQSPLLQRSVVLAHENAHRAGRHGLVELVAKALLSPLQPLALAASARASVRLHLEALADDAAARRHGRDTVGRALGLLALAEAPTVGLGMGGSSVWRVKRLLSADTPHQRLTVLGVLAPSLVLLTAGVAVAVYGVGQAFFCAAAYCLL